MKEIIVKTIRIFIDGFYLGMLIYCAIQYKNNVWMFSLFICGASVYIRSILKDK
jgi:hypothetical protein